MELISQNSILSKDKRIKMFCTPKTGEYFESIKMLTNVSVFILIITTGLMDRWMDYLQVLKITCKYGCVT